MSQIHATSPKHCAQKKKFNLQEFNFNRKKFLCSFSTFLLSLFSLIFLIYLFLHPSKPQFSLKQADIYQFNLTSPHLLTSSIQITMLSNNPNKKVGIFYENLALYGSYKGQLITMESSVPGFYQGCEETNVLSAVLGGDGLPVAPEFGAEVGRDQSEGRMVVMIKGNGSLRWKVGTWVSGKYRFSVNCVAMIMGLGSGSGSGSGSGPGSDQISPVSSKQGSQCSISL